MTAKPEETSVKADAQTRALKQAERDARSATECIRDAVKMDATEGARMTAGRIGTAGVYDIPMEDYHGDCCEGPSVSGSGLVKIEQLSPLHYWHSSYHNPKREEIDTTALSFGRAAHAWVLGEPEWNKYFILSPYADFRTKEARTWREQQTRTVVRQEQLDAVKAMADTILKTPLIQNAFQDGKAEQSLIWKDAETGLWCKSRPDWLPNALQYVPNYKTARSSRPADFARQAFSLGYHQGAALCIEGLRQVLGWKSPSYYFVAQEKAAPYVATLLVMREPDVEWGQLQNRRALRTLARCIDAGEWPGYATGAVEIEMPAWGEKQLLDRHERGEFTEDQEKAA